MQLSRDEQMILDVIREVAREKAAPRAAEIDRTGEFPTDMLRLFRELGLMGLTIPTEYGGAGLRWQVLSLVLEELASACANTADLISQHDVGIRPIVLAGSEEQKGRWLPALAAGKMLSAFGLTEPQAGSDQSQIATTAVRDGDHYVINGSKRFITWGNIADIIVVFALTDPAAGRAGLSAIVVPREAPGLTVGRLEEKLGFRGSPTAELFLENVRVPVANRLGNEGDGFKIAMRTLNYGRVAIASLAVGIARGALDYARSYLRDRVQFGRPVLQNQGIQFLVAEHATRLEAARQLLHRAARELDENGPELIRLTAMAKLFATDTAMAVTVDAVQMLGGYGYIKEYPVERMMRDAKLLQIVEGTNQIQKMVIANQLERR